PRSRPRSCSASSWGRVVGLVRRWWVRALMARSSASLCRVTAVVLLRGFNGWGRVSPWVSGRRGLSGRYSGVQAGPGASGGIGSQPKVPTPRSLARLLADDRFQVGGQRSESAGVHGRGGLRWGWGGFRLVGVSGGRGLGAL